jgi:3',5'-cyclic AMP phosphodiesterase CpdA
VDNISRKPGRLFVRKGLAVAVIVAGLGLWVYNTAALLLTPHFGPNFSGPIEGRVRLHDPKILRLAAIGDCRGNYRVLGALLKDAKARGADAVLLLGDMVDGGARVSFSFMNLEVREYAGDLPVFAIIGNHDKDQSGSARLFEQFFGPVHFWWRYGPVLFLIVNNSTIEPWDREVDWLRQTLAQQARPGDQLFLIMHQPPFIPGHLKWMLEDQTQALSQVISPYPGLQIITGHEQEYFQFDFQGHKVWVSGEGGEPQKVNPPRYGYFFFTCPSAACSIEHINMGYISPGWYVRRKIMLDFYWLWPGIALTVAAGWLVLHRRNRETASSPPP